MIPLGTRIPPLQTKQLSRVSAQRRAAWCRDWADSCRRRHKIGTSDVRGRVGEVGEVGLLAVESEMVGVVVGCVLHYVRSKKRRMDLTATWALRKPNWGGVVLAGGARPIPAGQARPTMVRTQRLGAGGRHWPMAAGI